MGTFKIKEQRMSSSRLDSSRAEPSGQILLERPEITL